MLINGWDTLTRKQQKEMVKEAEFAIKIWDACVIYSPIIKKDSDLK